MNYRALLTSTAFLSVALAGQSLGQTTITPTTLAGREAFRLTDGKTEAVVVPSLARVMQYGAVGGENWLWQAPAGQEMQGGWKNFGGEKAWVAPQGQWPVYIGHAFPPDPAWEADFRAEVLAGPPRLRLEGSPGKCGVSVSREFSFAENGEFVAVTTIHKTGAAPIMAGGWTVTQLPAPAAVFLPANVNSPYQDGVYRWPPRLAGTVSRVAPGLVRVIPSTAGSYKLGVDAPLGAIAAVKGRTAFVQRADPGKKKSSNYPDGAEGGGFPAEFYDHGEAERHYVELELLSPLSALHEAQSSTFTVRWSLRPLPGDNVDSPEVREAVAGFFGVAERP